MTFDGMAYRGDTTDPFGNMVQRQQIQRSRLSRVVLVLLLLWMAPNTFIYLWQLASPPPGPSRTIVAPTQTPTQTMTTPTRTVTAPTRTMTAPGLKMSATALERLLRTAPASDRAPRDVRCLPVQTGWDYVCTYIADFPHPQSRLKIGVRVSGNGILAASAPHQFAVPLSNP